MTHVTVRPVGTLKVAVVRGRGLVSSDLNLPGNAYVRVSYVVPDRCAELCRALPYCVVLSPLAARWGVSKEDETR